MRAYLCMIFAAFLLLAGCTKPKPTARTEVKPGGELIVRLSDNVTIKLVRIPAGNFIMGSPQTEHGRGDDEGPARTVTISKPFYMSVTEVTQEQYQALTNENPSTFKGAGKPVEEVSWEDASAFCKELSRLTGKTFRLPTEAQWEYACRAGTRTTYHNGNHIDDLKKAGWCNFDRDTAKSTHSVAGFQPNSWGLFDMHGNVWEWCADWYGENYYASGNNMQDPKGPQSGSERILRGGSWADDPEDCRAAYRESQPPAYSDDDIGFRIVCEE